MKIAKKINTIISSVGIELVYVFRYIRHSNSVFKNNSKSKLIGRIIAHYHVIEKGLTMPDKKVSFGQDALMNLINLLLIYKSNGYNFNDVQILAALNSISQYKVYHEKTNNLTDSLKGHIDNILSFSENSKYYEKFENIDTTYYQNIKSLNFIEFSKKRFSLRNFSGANLSIDSINEAIELAMNAPSACNRQANRVYVTLNDELLNKILKLQSGNRGFGYLAKGLIVCTSEVGVFDGLNEIREPYLNSGMFIMNLVYALQFCEIGSCILNWAVFNDRDKKLRDLLKIPKSEVVTVLIAIGKLPDKEITITKSKRYKGIEITKYV